MPKSRVGKPIPHGRPAVGSQYPVHGYASGPGALVSGSVTPSPLVQFWRSGAGAEVGRLTLLFAGTLSGKPVGRQLGRRRLGPEVRKSTHEA